MKAGRSTTGSRFAVIWAADEEVADADGIVSQAARTHKARVAKSADAKDLKSVRTVLARSVTFSH